ncbi:MAG TPA: flagellar basal-body MS-ring/collar protein FliF [Bacillota bacterium]
MDFNAIRRQIASTWARLTGRQRSLVIAAALVAVLTLAIWSAVYARGPQYATVFSSLTAQDAAAIVKQLDSDKTPHKLTDGGTTIQVPAKDVYSTRLALASAGLPSGGVVGFEIIDKTQLGATDFERRVNYIRALQGELTRTITQVAEVEEARVHIVLPEQSYFVTMAKPATAAVFLKVKPGVTLDKSQIQGIVNLISRSVEGLKAEDVSVIDVHGYLLSADLGGAETPDRVSTGLLEVQKKFQKDLEKSVQGLLEQVIGPGQVVARVTAEMNFDQKVVDKDLFEPVVNETGIIRSIQELEENMTGSTQGASGAAGTSSNVPGYAAGSGTDQSSSDKTTSTRTYEINNIKEHIVVAPGTVKRLSVAVVINRDLQAKDQKAIEDTVRAAIGLDSTRNDQIMVSGIKFDTSMAEAVAADMSKAKKQNQWVSLAIRILLAAVVGFILWRILFGGGKKREEILSDVFTSEERRAQVIAEIGQEELPPEEVERRRLREQVDQLAKKKPDEFAKVLKTWLTED